MPVPAGSAGRAPHAHLKMVENLALFVPLVLAAQLAGRNKAVTAYGAEIFFFARLAYGFVYVPGIPCLRTAAWTLAVIGLIMIFTGLL
jgi:uncharacterized MAPEG superfamily protein